MRDRLFPLGPLLLMAESLRGRRIFIRVDSPDEAIVRMERNDGSRFGARLIRKQGLNVMHNMTDQELDQLESEERLEAFLGGKRWTN